MAWNPNVEGNYAWLATQAKEHGGVMSYIEDIHNGGFQEGFDQGVVQGVVGSVSLIAAGYGIYRIIMLRRIRKQAIIEQSELAQKEIERYYNDKSSDTENEVTLQ